MNARAGCHGDMLSISVNMVEVCGYIWHSTRSEVVVVQLPMQVADFGMCRDLEDENYYISHGGKIPVKWSAPEVGVCELRGYT